MPPKSLHQKRAEHKQKAKESCSLNLSSTNKQDHYSISETDMNKTMSQTNIDQSNDTIPFKLNNLPDAKELRVAVTGESKIKQNKTIVIIILIIIIIIIIIINKKTI